MNTLVKIGDVYNVGVLYINGISTDNKPINKIENVKITNGSEYLEIDTGKKFSYNEATKQWVEHM